MFSTNQVESTIIMLLLLLAVSSCMSQNSSTIDTGCMITGSPVNIDHCSNNSSCPTWFVCNTENRCRCDKITNKIVCDDEAQISAVLNCNCVTYNSARKINVCWFLLLQLPIQCIISFVHQNFTKESRNTDQPLSMHTIPSNWPPVW